MKKSSLIITLFLLALNIMPVSAQSPDGEEYTVQADDWLSKLADKFFETARQYEAYALAEPPLGLDQEFDRVGGEMSGLQLRILSTFNRRYDLLAGEDLQ